MSTRSVALPGSRLAWGVLEEIAGMLRLTWQAMRLAVTPPFTWWGEFVEQTYITVSRCFFPVVVSTLAFGFGNAGVQPGNLLSVFGSVDRSGAFLVAASVREFGPWVNAMVIAGIAGTAICADLGARKARDELDALAVMGIDAVRSLVVPRFLALGIVTALMNLVAVLRSGRKAVAQRMIIGTIVRTQVNVPAARFSSAIAGERPSIRNIWIVIATVSGPSSPRPTAPPAKPRSFSVVSSWYQAAISVAEWFGDCAGSTPVPKSASRTRSGNTYPQAAHHNWGRTSRRRIGIEGSEVGRGVERAPLPRRG